MPAGNSLTLIARFCPGFNPPWAFLQIAANRRGERGDMAIRGYDGVPEIPPDRPVLIAGPTASGKSELALRIAETSGGAIVNADASQVYDCWRVITARPTPEDEARAPHALYGHVTWQSAYSTGHWLRDVRSVLDRPVRPIIIGGTGLYFSALTQGLADIPATPPDIRAKADQMPLPDLLAGISPATAALLDQANRARVQRAWEVEQATGRALHDWQAGAHPALLPAAQAVCLLVQTDRDWLNNRIAARFDQMLANGALDEVAAMRAQYDPDKPAFRAIGVPELVAHIRGEISLETASAQAKIGRAHV